LGRARRVYQTNRPRGTTAAGHGWGGRCRVAVTGAARAVPHVVRKFARGGGRRRFWTGCVAEAASMRSRAYGVGVARESISTSPPLRPQSHFTPHPRWSASSPPAHIVDCRPRAVVRCRRCLSSSSVNPPGLRRLRRRKKGADKLRIRASPAQKLESEIDLVWLARNAQWPGLHG
jgi:hypothetical protein